MEQIGIQKLYNGDQGEIRLSNFRMANGLSFQEKNTLSFKYVLAGQENYVVDRKHFTVAPGQALFFRESKPYQGFIDCPDLTKGLCIDLSFSMVTCAQMDVLSENELFLLSPEFKTQRIVGLNDQLHRLLGAIGSTSNDSRELFFEESLNELSFQILQLEEEYLSKMNSLPAKKASYRKETFRRLLNAQNYIQDRKYEAVSLRDIAGACGLSVFYLHRLFKQVFGYTPSEYVEYLRMEEAKEILRILSVKETSYAVGYTDEAYFSRRFKKYQGMTPGTFSKLLS